MHHRNSSAASRNGDGKRVGLWIRVSTEEQAKGESPEHHEARGQMYAEMKGWVIATVYHLEAVSGESVLGHPEAKRMLEDVRSGRVSAVLFSKLARLGRDTMELLEIEKFFRQHNADLVSIQELIDTSTAAGRQHFRNLSSNAQWEREEIAERVAASVPIRAKLGKPLGGIAPFGYQWQGRKLVLNEEESPIRRLMFELFLEHKRLKTVARLLNETGYRTRSGALFSNTTVERLIRDPTAKGLRRANYTKSLKKERRWVEKPEDEWVWNEVPAIVPEELWDQANAILDERRRTGKRPARRPVHLFGGLVVCQCGKKLYVPANSPHKYVCFGCRNKIPIVDLERIFEGQLKSFLFSPEEVRRHLEASDQELEEKRVLLSALGREREKVSEEMEKLYRLYLGDHLSPDAFGKRNRPLEERLRQLEREIPRLQGELDFLAIRHLGCEEALSGTQNLFNRWQALSFEERRAIVEAIVERVTVGKDEVSLLLTYDPPPEELATKGARTPRGS